MSKSNSSSSGLLSIIKKSFNQVNNRYLDLVNQKKIPQILKQKYSFVIIVLLGILLFYFLFSDTSSNTNIPTYTIKKDVFLVSISENGEIKAKKSIAISAPRIRSSLKIIQLVPEGNYIEAGEVVAKFDPTEVLTMLRDAEAKLEMSRSDKNKLLANHASQMAQMESDLKSSELSFELSKLNMEQMKFEAEAKRREAELQHNKNELNFQKTKQTFESKKIIQRSELENTNVEIRQKINELAKAQRDLDALTLISTAEGLVVYGINWSNQGQKFQVGDQPWRGQVIVTLPDLSKMESHTYVNEVDISKVKTGQKVEVKLDAFQDSIFWGEVAKVARLGKKKDDQSTIKVFDVFIDIKGVSEILKPGMTTSNKIIMDEINDRIFIPHEALFNVDEEIIVYKKNGFGFDEVVVKAGKKSDDFVIIESGLEDGDVVALRNPYEKISDEEIEENNSVKMPENGI
ncbi:MAG: HlyD family efflux transporter periplasmic adaptor subunit [Ignavibacteriae bacterium]|nr:HlyD family efflux transporter periplasmic adaptor subunit [Ignavibacteriota bacterium]